MIDAIRIKRFRLGKRGIKQMEITIPRIWMEEHELLKEDDYIEMQKDVRGRLILVPCVQK